MAYQAQRPEKRIAILQSCYIPWKGYFDIVGAVDEFVVFDTAQYRKNHWHNRNIVKTQHGAKWLTIPVSKADGAFCPLESVKIARPFSELHWRTISQSYCRAPFFDRYGGMLEALFRAAAGLETLSAVNLLFLEALSAELGLKTKFIKSSELKSTGAKTEKLIEICLELDAARYLSGPSASAYLEVDKFADAGIAVDWADYTSYPVYPQLHGDFIHEVSIIDLLMNAGPSARSYMKLKAHKM